MIPTTDFALKCANPILPPRSGQPIDTLIFEYAAGVIGYISFAAAGRAGYSASTIASVHRGLQVEINSSQLLLVSRPGDGRLAQLSFDAVSGILHGAWQDAALDGAEFGGPCTIRLRPFFYIRMPPRPDSDYVSPPSAPEPGVAERRAELLKRAEEERLEALRRHASDE